MAILEINQEIGSYSVDSLLREGQYNESYKIKNTSGESFLLKIYDLRKVPDKVLNADSIITEISYCEQMNHANVISYVEKGVFVKNESNYPYLVTKYVQGSLVADPLVKGRIFSRDMALDIVKNALKGLSYIHSLGFVHNDITPRNIIYNPKDLSTTTIIDLAHVSVPGADIHSFETADLTNYFRAPETYNYIFDERSDIYAMAAVLYAMLFGQAPWYSESEENLSYEQMKKVTHERLSFSGSLDKCPFWLQAILKMCLSFDPNRRIQTAEEFLQALEREECPRPGKTLAKREFSSVDAQSKRGIYKISPKEGNGFADVAGMDDIKAMLQQKVLFLLKNPEKVQKYKLTLPNGMLLYGPPGCGKTFFAEKFAEEACLNYICVKGSDISSSYIHGSQSKIAQLFEEAEQKAPSVICFDEFDAMVPKRTSAEANTLVNPEVNEFLSQMNNCSQRGIFIIGTTNQKELIDPAILRTGRLDIHIEVGAPDKATRKKMFDLYLKDRPCVEVDTEELADKTDNYSSSDISFIVNDAALVAAFKDSPIDQSMLLDSIKNRPSSLGASANKAVRRKIGFA